MSEETYTNTDLGEAAALYCLGFDLVGLEPTSKPGQRAFIFSRHAGRIPEWAEKALGPLDYAEAVVELYRSRSRGIMVNAHDYFLAIKELKSRLFDDIDR